MFCFLVVLTDRIEISSLLLNNCFNYLGGNTGCVSLSQLVFLLLGLVKKTVVSMKMSHVLISLCLKYFDICIKN